MSSNYYPVDILIMLREMKREGKEYYPWIKELLMRDCSSQLHRELLSEDSLNKVMSRIEDFNEYDRD